MKIIDNFLTKSYHRDILEILSGLDFDWSYSPNISGINDRENCPEPPQYNEYGFSHIFWDEEKGATGRFAPYIQPLLFQILDATDCDFLLRARADMVTWTGKEEFIHLAHTDYPFPNTASIFYINETDGDTIFYNVKPDDVPKNKELKEYDRVSPKANRLVIFDGDLLHTGCSPTKYKNRILINSNYIKKDNVEEFKTLVENRRQEMGG